MEEIEEFEEEKSKSQIKREVHALRDVGRELVELSNARLGKIPMPERLRDAILDAKRFKREARRRQLQYIARMMHGMEPEVDVIRRDLTEHKKPHKAEVAALHDAEQWRDALIAGNDNLMEELIGRFENADRQHLRQLIRNARKEQENNKPLKFTRLLYQYLHELRVDEK